MAEEERQNTEQSDNTTDSQEETQGQNTQDTQETATDVSKQVEAAKAEGKKEALRNVSKQLGVNVFDEKEFQTYIDSQKNKVDRDELEKVKAQAEEYKGYKQERDDLALDNALVKNGVRDEYSDKMKKLVKAEQQENPDKDTADIVTDLIKEMPMFTSKARRAGMDVNNDNSSNTAADEYMKDNYDFVNGRWVPKKR